MDETIDLEKIRREITFVRDLNFSDGEIIANYSRIIEIHNNLYECQNSGGQTCINPTQMHEQFYRGNDNKLKLHYVECDTYIRHKENYKYLYNYLICDYDEAILKNAKNQEDNIRMLTDKKKIYKFQADLIRNLKVQLKTGDYRGLYLYGGFGVGKTYLMSLFGNNLAEYGYKVCFVNIPKLIKKINHSDDWQDRFNNQNEYGEKMMNCSILILDEVGMERFSYNFHIEFLLPILVHRLENKLPVYFISNFNFEKLKLNYNKYSKTSNTVVDKLINTIENLVLQKIIEINGIDLRKKIN